MDQSVSFLLGAGFSAPMGYPVGTGLNKSLLECTGKDFSFHSDGRLIVRKDGAKPNIGYKTSYDFEFDFCRHLMQYYYEKNGYFDYEEFYDFFNYQAKEDPEVKSLFDTNNYGTQTDFDQILFGIKNVFTQLVSYYLIDGEGNSWYNKSSSILNQTFQEYSGILDCLKKFGENHVVNIHTLNHDLFFETLNNTDWLHGDLCDGFEELGSPYYGDLSTDKRNYKCRLPCFTNNYDKVFRLFKLHGSKDYGIYYTPKNTKLTPNQYVKTVWGVGFNEFLKEVEDQEGKLYYDRCWVNYHADFLTGTSSKIDRYEEPQLFKILFNHFKENLKNAKQLIIIGYGGRDSEVNKMIMNCFDFKNKPCYIIDPYAGKDIRLLKKRIRGKLIEKQLADIKWKDLND